MTTLSPLDLLLLPDDEQSIFRCLSRRPRLTVTEISTKTHLPLDRLEDVLSTMVGKNYLVEQLSRGERTFSVRFSGERKRVRNLAESILGVLDQTSGSFLNQVELLQRLTSEERQRLWESGEKRTIQPEEVYLWQGKEFDHVGIVCDGLLRRSRLKSNRAITQGHGYLSQYEWFGLSESLAEESSTDTYSAVTETHVIQWTKPFFLEFFSHIPSLSVAVSQYLSRQWQRCQRGHQSGKGNLWVIESVFADDTALQLAHDLAKMLVSERDSRVLVWTVRATEAGRNRPVTVRDTIERSPHGYDTLPTFTPLDYPPQTQLDIILTTLQENYDYIIVDSGSDLSGELLARLRGRAATLLTLTPEAENPEGGMMRWKHSQSFAHPTQKRYLLLTRPITEMPDPAFYLVLPMVADENRSPALYEGSVRELFRRLSLTHTIGIFIPSTLDVDQAVDNSGQVQSALELLGTLFGGATRTDAEGAWRSEDSGLVVEQVTIVRTFVTKDALDSHLEQVVDFAMALKKEMRQESIALDVDHNLVLV